MAQPFTVLIVDDDDLVRATLVDIVEAKGFRVLAANSAIEAMRIIAQEDVDLLFTDIMMPDQTGIELAREAKKLRPNLQVMFSRQAISPARRKLAHSEPSSTSRCGRTRSKRSLIVFFTRGAASHHVRSTRSANI